MWYETSITITAGTEEASPIEETLKLTYGIIHRVVIEAAPGCHRAAKIRICRGGHQVYPTNPDKDIALDSVPRVFDDREPLLTKPYLLTIKGYAPDATYDHVYRIGIGLMPPSAFPEYREAESLIEKIAKLMGIKR